MYAKYSAAAPQQPALFFKQPIQPSLSRSADGGPQREDEGWETPPGRQAGDGPKYARVWPSMAWHGAVFVLNE